MILAEVDMHIAIIGSGPVGMTAALLLNRDGHRVTLVDRDPGPVPGRPWARVGVMQFHLPHGFRAQSRVVLRTRLPDVYEAVIAAGAVVVAPPGTPDAAAWLQIRRSVFERTLWEATTAEAGVHRLTGHVDRVEVDGDTAVGVTVDSGFVAADLVVDASGRAGRIRGVPRVTQRVACGMAYASRQYRLRVGATPGPVNAGPGYLALHRGFLVFVFAHDAGVFTVLFVRPSDDQTLAELRHPEIFEAACRLVPGLAEWTEDSRSEPIDVVRAGAGLANTYASQPTAVRRLVTIGDAFCTTNPQGGRGISLGLQSAAALADLVGDHPVDEVPARLDAWGTRELLPWYRDHVAWDAALLAQWAGRPVREDGPVGPETLVAAAQQFHPEWMTVLAAYFGMAVTPAALDPIRAQVRDLIRGGWQPPEPPGPSRAELAALIREPVPV